MTAPARLGGWPAARREQVVARQAGPVAPTRSLLAPPAPVPPCAPPPRRRPLASPEHQRVLAPARVRHPLASRSSRVARVFAAAVVTLAVVGALGWIEPGWSEPGASPSIPAQTSVIQVGAGETVWDVARRVAPQSDQPAVVERIQQLNGIVGSAITPGQQLQVPDGR